MSKLADTMSNESAIALDEKIHRKEEPKRKKSSHDEAKADSIDLTKLLQSLGVEELDYANDEGNTQLHLAADSGKTKLVESLLARGAKTNIKNNEGNTALHLATRKGHNAIVNTLLEQGANVNASNYSNRHTALHWACFNRNNVNLVRLLLKFGAEIEGRSFNGQTALHVASLRGQSAVINMLLEHGANINAQDDYGDSPLHVATRINRGEVVSILLRNNAEFNLKNQKQETAVDVAKVFKDVNLIRIFENYAGSSSTTNKE